MKKAWTTSRESLRERLTAKEQVPAPTAAAEMPPYMESFLAHLRLLVGVPFDYLVPDARLLPDESIRFFYLDRSWTDRLVDGAVAVGKIGTREQAHHHAHHPNVSQQLDLTERSVRDLQRGQKDFAFVRNNPIKGKAGVITGFLIRSAAVSGWPHMDVRAFDRVLPQNFNPDAAAEFQLRTLRLERLSPAVLLALFDGVPKMVICEEPHHGIQFGVHEQQRQFRIFRRMRNGTLIAGSQDVTVPVRRSNPRVLAIATLRRKLMGLNSQMPTQNGSAAMAIELLNVPWRQRFQGAGGRPQVTGNGAFVANVTIAPQITQAELQTLIKGFVLGGS